TPAAGALPGATAPAAPPVAPRKKPQRDLATDPKALRARVHAELRAFVQALAEGEYEEAARSIRQGESEAWDGVRLAAEVRHYQGAHGEIRFDPARVRGHHTTVKGIAPRVFRAQHALLDAEGEEQGFVEGEVDLREARDPEGPLVRLLGIRP
ncbi:MAG: DUF3516 domain-containing protein, partial [Parvularculaceae bacterium]|nr:DUF3516 domain-containing protein [Parvularculaceae bacterium]